MSDAGFVPLAGFTAVGGFTPASFTAPLRAPEPPDDDEYARGLADGQQLAATAFAEERVRFQRLIGAMEALRPYQPTELEAVFVGAFERLMARMPVDADWLRTQIAEAIAAADHLVRPLTIHLHPDDLVLIGETKLDFAVQPDASLPPGSVRLESQSGSIEHGRVALTDAVRRQLAAEP